jgi:tetratricopeptide (TPR) repeat protein
MPGTDHFKYTAFLSYSHADSSAARWLHRALERFPISADLVGRETPVGPVPSTLRPIFRDRDDFSGGHSLQEATLRALRTSKFLIVLCSPNAALSQYVNEEVRLFKELGGNSRIIPVILDGEPGDPKHECFPPAVKYTVDEAGTITSTSAEPVAPDMRSVGDGRRRALTKIAAGLLGVSHDAIARRAEVAWRRRAAVRMFAAVAIVALALTSGFFYLNWRATQSNEAALQILVDQLIASQARASGGDQSQLEGPVTDAIAAAASDAASGDARMEQALELLGQNKVEQAAVLFRALAEERATQSTLARDDAAGAYRNLGAIAGLADPVAAREAYGRALQYAPDDPESLYWHGWLNLLAGNLEIAKGSLEHLLEISLRDEDDHGVYRARLRLGRLAALRGDLDTALEDQRTALAIALARAALRPQDPQRRRDVAVSHEKVGNVLRAQGNLPEALASYRASLAIMQELVDGAPDIDSRQRDLSVAYVRIGDVIRDQGDLPSALENYTAALSIRQQLVERSPDNAQWQRDYSSAHNRMGDVLARQGQLEAAIDHYRQSLAIREQLVVRDPDNGGWRQDEFYALIRIARALDQLGDLPEAMSILRRAHAVITGLVNRDDANADWQRDLASSHMALGTMLEKQAKHADAAVHFRTALSIRQALVALDDDNANWQRDLSFSHDVLGGFLFARGDTAGAEVLFRAALEIRRQLFAADPSSSEIKRLLAVSHGRLGDAANALGDAAAALDHYRSAMGLFSELVGADATNRNWLDDLAVVNGRIGRVLFDLERHQEAIDSYTDERTLLEALSGNDTANTRWSQMLADTHFRLAQAYLADANGDAARAHLATADELMRSLVEQDPSNSQWQSLSSRIAAAIAAIEREPNSPIED